MLKWGKVLLVPSVDAILDYLTAFGEIDVIYVDDVPEDPYHGAQSLVGSDISPAQLSKLADGVKVKTLKHSFYIEFK